MKKTKLFKGFLESLKNGKNNGLIESIKAGYALMEMAEPVEDKFEVLEAEYNDSSEGVDVVVTVRITDPVLISDPIVLNAMQRKAQELSTEASDVCILARVSGNVNGNWNGSYYPETDVSPEEYPELEDVDVGDIDIDEVGVNDGFNGEMSSIDDEAAEAKIREYVTNNAHAYFDIEEASEHIEMPEAEYDGPDGDDFDYEPSDGPW
jgi:hypothetical protein